MQGKFFSECLLWPSFSWKISKCAGVGFPFRKIQKKVGFVEKKVSFKRRPFGPYYVHHTKSPNLYAFLSLNTGNSVGRN